MISHVHLDYCNGVAGSYDNKLDRFVLHATHAIRRGAELSIDYGVDGWCKEEVVGRYGFAPSKVSPCTATKSTRDRKRKKKRRITPMLTPANVDKWVAGKA